MKGGAHNWLHKAERESRQGARTRPRLIVDFTSSYTATFIDALR
jgi:hypothetical protein